VAARRATLAKIAVAGFAVIGLSARPVRAATHEATSPTVTAVATPAQAAAATRDSASDAAASPPSELSVTVYRAPKRGSGSIDLDALEGFALISETRTVHLPAGVSRLRFDGVADGIEPASAIVTGLAQGVIEKNREGKLLSPFALLDAAVGKPVTLLRTDKKTGKSSRIDGTLVSDAEGGVVFQTAAGVEALRCSGLPESFSFSAATDLAATPTLSVLVRTSQPVTQTVTLSYLARGFDWSAEYVATLSADGKTLDLGAWVTLENGNGAGFPQAHTQVVAGRVNRESGAVEPIDIGGPILAQCWPRGSTSDPPEYLQFKRAAAAAARAGFETVFVTAQAVPAPMAQQSMKAAQTVAEEQLGDLKLYRVPDRTTVAARQSKQVRLLDRAGIPVATVYDADLDWGQDASSVPARRLLRTINSAANHLGLPLPSGRIAVFTTHRGEKLLEHESGMRDLAVDEEMEITMGESADIRVTSTQPDAVTQVDISNARATPAQFELRLRLPEGRRVVRADHPLGTKNGRPIFRLTLPANETVTVRYWTQAAEPGRGRASRPGGRPGRAGSGRG